MSTFKRRSLPQVFGHRWAVAALGALLLVVSGLVTPAHAFQLQVIDRARFVGQITALLPVNGSPTGFVLLQPNLTVTISINPQTQLTGSSAEANVEGLARDDYAVVNAKHVQGRWIATKITYDVDPILPLRIVSGSVVKLAPDGRRVNVKLDTGASRWITIGRLARYRLDGRAVDPPPILLKGELVQFVINRTTVPWLALEVDARTV
jgi:hypothetical protein